MDQAKEDISQERGNPEMGDRPYIFLRIALDFAVNEGFQSKDPL
jgi:hypothetical protein